MVATVTRALLAPICTPIRAPAGDRAAIAACTADGRSPRAAARAPARTPSTHLTRSTALWTAPKQSASTSTRAGMVTAASAGIAILAMARHGANVTALECLRESGFTGKVATVAHYEDEIKWAREHGVPIAFNVYAGAGLELADAAARAAGLKEIAQ